MNKEKIYLRPGTVKGEPKEEIYEEFIQLIREKGDNIELLEDLSDVIDFYKENYAVLSHDADEELIKLVTKLSIEEQVTILIDITSGKLTVDSMSTFGNYWLATPELEEHPRFEGSYLKESYERDIKVIQSAMQSYRITYSKIADVVSKSVQSIQETFKPMLSVYAKTVPILYPAIEVLNITEPLIPSSEVLSTRRYAIPTKNYGFEYIKNEINELKETSERIYNVLTKLYIATQSGLLTSIETDEKLLAEVLKNKELETMLGEEILEILAERTLIREILGIKHKKGFVKSLMEKLATIEMLMSIYLALVKLFPKLVE